MTSIDKEFLGGLFEQAVCNPRLRQNYDLRTSSEDNSQRMLNALLPGTSVPVHRHPQSSETVVCLCGKMVEVLFEEVSVFESGDEELLRGGFEAEVSRKTVLREVERIHLDPSLGNYGCVVPAGTWHTVEVLEPSIIFEAKDGRYGEDGSETYGTSVQPSTKEGEPKNDETNFRNSLGDLKKNIEYLIGVERYSGSMEVITPLYVARMLNVPLEEVEVCMKEMGV